MKTNGDFLTLVAGGVIFIISALVLLFMCFSVPAAEAAGGGAEKFYKELHVGSRGPEVEFVQSILREAGCYPAEVETGYFGLNTLAAVAKFQKKMGLAVNGEVGAGEWQHLKEIARRLRAGLGDAKLGRQVVGYYTHYENNKDSYNSLSRYGKDIDYIATFSYSIDSNGNLIGEAPQDALALARKMNVKPLMLVHNMLNTIDSASVHSVISNTRVRQKLIKNVTQVVTREGYVGVNVDFEGVYPSDRKYFNSFLKELASVLAGEGCITTISIPAKTWDNPQSSWFGAYDYKEIGKIVDMVMLMTYDEHWYGGTPGPIASLPWVQQVLDYATAQIPRDKLLLGVGAYGYDWSSHGARSIPWNQVQDLIERYKNVKWHNEYCVPYLVYYENGVKHEVWFENTYSLRFKLDIADSYKLGGIAIWRLGFEDNSFWEMVEKKF